MSGMLIGWTTTSNRDDAEKLAAGAVESELAACCQIDGPFLSVYRWKGEIQKDEEFRLTFKFLSRNAEALESWLYEEHPYENPQWVAVAAERISEKYLNWVREESK